MWDAKADQFFLVRSYLSIHDFCDLLALKHTLKYLIRCIQEPLERAMEESANKLTNQPP